ncbi:MAG: hypothetical protein IPK53_12450 [bacterium]|nr:hypothetical protein [bacterium]
MSRRWNTSYASRLTPTRVLVADGNIPFASYHQEWVRHWSQPRYRYDSRLCS